MDYSARNTIPGEVVSVDHDRVTGLVQIKIADGIVLSSDITATSVERLCLKPGKKVNAIIKANNVIIGVDDGKKIRLSARNILPGKIVEVKLGVVNAEIQIEIASGIVISSTITVASAQRLDLQVGKKACAIIKSTNVIVADA